MSREARRERLLSLLETLGLGAAVLRTPANFAHYTNGADNRVDHADPSGVAALVISPEGEWVITDNIEAGRMREEQTPGFEVVDYPWHEGPDALVRELAGGRGVGSDLCGGYERDISGSLAPLRYVLDADAAARYRLVGAEATAAVEETASALSPGTTELEATAALQAALRRSGLNAPVLLAGGRERASRYRHPVVRTGSSHRLGGRAMLVACAERGGLYANVTRMVEFEEPGNETKRLQRACDDMLARAREATRPGRALSEILDDLVEAYRKEGFPDGWRYHHQGGLTGYASREVIATPRTSTEIQTGMAFAWNPSVSSPQTTAFGKAEETFLLTESGPEVLTRSGGARGIPR